MNKPVILLLIAILVITLSGCTSQPVSKESACLVGTWELMRPEVYGRTLLPTGAIPPEKLSFVNADGDLTYTFDKSGILTVETEVWIANFLVNEGSSQMVLELIIKGVARGKYVVDGDILGLEKITDKNLKYAAILDDYAMIDTDKVEDFAVLFEPSLNSLKFTCTDESLRLTIENIPGVTTPIIFSRK